MNYFERCGQEFDVAVNVITGGQENETVSYRCAVAARAGKRWGCFMCRLLSWLVQRDHCADQFTAGPTKLFVFIRAGIAFGVAGIAIACTVRVGFHIIRSFV